MKKTKLMLLLVPTLLLMGCNTSSSNSNNSSSSTSSGNSGNSSSETTNDVPEEFQPETNIPDSEKGSVITFDQAATIVANAGLDQPVDEEVVKEYVENSPALEFGQIIKNDKSNVKTKYDYSYGAKYCFFYTYLLSDPQLPEGTDPSLYTEKLYGENWNYDYVRDGKYFDLSHQISQGWVDMTSSDMGIQWVDTNNYFYEEKETSVFDAQKPGYSSICSLSQVMYGSGTSINAYLALGSYSSALGIEMETRSAGSDSLYFYINAMDYMGVVMEAQIKAGRLEYVYSYTDLVKLAEIGGSTQEQIQEIIDSGITHQSSEMSYHQIAVTDLEYPNEAYYKEQAGK